MATPSRALLMAFTKKPGYHFAGTPYGPKRYTASRKKNRRVNRNELLANLEVLKIAAANEPEVPTRLYKNLCHWQTEEMKKQMERTRRVLGWQSSSGGSTSADLAAAVQAVTLAVQQQRARQIASPAQLEPQRLLGPSGHRSFSSLLLASLHSG